MPHIFSPQRAQSSQRFFFQLIDQTAYSSAELRDIEVDQQANRAPGEFEIGEQLSLMNWLQPFDGLQFDNHLLFHQQVNAIAALQLYSAIFDGQRPLPLDLYPSFNQLVCEAGLIG
jgi:hypothetical protein